MNYKGMNKIICSLEGIENIRNPPDRSVQTYGILHGSGVAGRDYDFPTAQTLSNGVVLYYTPPAEQPTSSSANKLDPNVEKAVAKASHHRGLGHLDMLPVSPQVIFSHGGARGIVRAMGGRSRGFRSATRASVYSANRNLILWSYSLVRDMDVWKQELLSLTADARVLFIKGTKDWMAPEIVLRPVRQQMKAKTWQINVQDTDHNFNCPTELQEQKLCSVVGVLAGLWLRGDTSDGSQAGTHPWDPEDGTEMLMHYDAEKKEAV